MFSLLCQQMHEDCIPALPGTRTGVLEVQVSLEVGPRFETGFWFHTSHLRSWGWDSSHLRLALEAVPGLVL